MRQVNSETRETIQSVSLLAQNSLLYEAVLTPKPGLVDPADCGSHQDMTIFTFIDSASSLLTGFNTYYLTGYHHQGSLPELFTQIRPIGLKLEQAMNQATTNINTHKGAIFSFGLILASLGYQQQQRLQTTLAPEQTQQLFLDAQLMVADTLALDFQDLQTKQHLTNGERLFLSHGIRGIRGEALDGYPLIQELALPYLRKMKASPTDLSTEQQLLTVLYLFISQSEDSNLINRGGMAGLAWAQKQAQDVLKNKLIERPQWFNLLMEVNQRFVLKNLSPGGSADLLALTIFIAKLEDLI